MHWEILFIFTDIHIAKNISAGIDFYIGLPKPLQYRAARLEHVPVPKELMEKQMENFKGDPAIYQLNLRQPQDWNAVSLCLHGMRIRFFFFFKVLFTAMLQESTV